MFLQRRLTARRIVTTSFLVDVLDIALNVAVAILTGSIILLAEALQATADLVSAGFVLLGLRRSERAPDKEHPFGHGRELYFWTLVSSLVMFLITSALSIYLGFKRFLSPQPLENTYLAFIVLAIAVISNGYSLTLSAKRLLGKKKTSYLVNSFFESILIETKTTFVLDLAGTTAALVGLLSLTIYVLTGDLRLDGVGAMLIGITLAILSFFLLISTKDLLVGKSAPKDIEEKIMEIASEVPNVRKVSDLKTIIIGNERVMVNLDINLTKYLNTKGIESVIEEVKTKVQTKIPFIKYIQVEPHTKQE